MARPKPAQRSMTKRIKVLLCEKCRVANRAEAYEHYLAEEDDPGTHCHKCGNAFSIGWISDNGEIVRD